MRVGVVGSDNEGIGQRHHLAVYGGNGSLLYDARLLLRAVAPIDGGLVIGHLGHRIAANERRDHRALSVRRQAGKASVERERQIFQRHDKLSARPQGRVGTNDHLATIGGGPKYNLAGPINRVVGSDISRSAVAHDHSAGTGDVVSLADDGGETKKIPPR